MKNLSKITLITILFLFSTLSWLEKRTFFNFRGTNFYVVNSSSMEPTIPKGSIVITQHTNTISIGDIVTMRYPLNYNKTITHRIVDIEERGYRSKGDANKTRDPWLINKRQVKGKVVFSIPVIGLVIQFIRNPIGLFGIVLLPLGTIVLLESYDLYTRTKYPTGIRTINRKAG